MPLRYYLSDQVEAHGFLPVQVDGTLPDGNLDSIEDEAAGAPFYVFDPNQQDYIAGPFPNKELAQTVADTINKHWET